MVLFNASFPQAAMNCFEYASSLDGKSVQWRYYIGLCHDDLYDTAESIEAYEAARSLKPDYGPILVKLARLRQKSDVAAARSLYEKAVQLAPKNPMAHFGLGECALLSNDPAGAIPHFEKAVDLAPNYSEAREALARCLDTVGKHEHASAQRSRIRKDAPPVMADDPLYFELLKRATAGRQLAQLGEALAESGQIDQALTALQAAVKKDETDLLAREELARLLDRTGHSREAVGHLRIILNRQPQDFDTALNLAWALMNIGEYPEAYQLGLDVLGSEPNNPRAAAVCGWAQLRSGRPKNSLIYFDRLMKDDPRDADSNYAVAIAQVCLLRFESAAEHYQRAGAQQPAGKDLMKEFVPNVLRVMMEQHRNAVTDRRAQVALPKCFEPLAAAFESKGMIAEAKAARAYMEVLFEQAVGLARLGEFKDGLEFVRLGLADKGGDANAGLAERFKRYLDSHPKELNIRHLWALVLADIGDMKAAQVQWAQVLADNPKFLPAYLSWTIELVGREDYAGARRVLEESNKHISDSPLLDNALAWVLATAPDPQMRDPARAVELAKSASAKANDKNPGVLDTLAVAYASLGNFEAAVRYEQEAIKVSRETTNRESLSEYRERLKLFEKKVPFIAGQKPATSTQPSSASQPS